MKIILLLCAAGALTFFSALHFEGTQLDIRVVPVAQANVATPASADGNPKQVVLFKSYLAKDSLRPAGKLGLDWLYAWDLGLDVKNIGAANPGSQFKVGEYIAVPIAIGHSWRACATYYGDQDHGKVQADGTVFDQYGISVAVKELPKPNDPRNKVERTKVTIYFPETGVMVPHVPVRDSGPYVAACDNYPGLPRAVDLSKGLMLAGGVPLSQGTTQVIITLESISPPYVLKAPREPKLAKGGV